MVILASSVAYAQEGANSIADSEIHADDGGSLGETAQETGNSAYKPRFAAQTVRPVLAEREKLLLLLSTHCDFPTKEDLVSSISDVEVHLISLTEDESLIPTVRSRALRALGYFDSSENEEALQQALRSSHAVPRMMLASMIQAYGRIGKERSVELIKLFLDHHDDMVKISAINSLRNCECKEGEDALRERMVKENNLYFKRRIESALGGK